MNLTVYFTLFNVETGKYRKATRTIRSDGHLLEEICNFLRDGFHLVKMTRE